jgi:hypothetical protein
MHIVHDRKGGYTCRQDGRNSLDKRDVFEGRCLQSGRHCYKGSRDLCTTGGHIAGRSTQKLRSIPHMPSAYKQQVLPNRMSINRKTYSDKAR